jgi:serine/threonine-protein kinase
VSPEQALGNEVDGRSDVYSLGVTSFFALTGRLPFEAESVEGMLARHVQEPPPSVMLFRPDIPGKLGRAIDQCLGKDPEDRFGKGQDLAEAVGEARRLMEEAPLALQEVRKAGELLLFDGVGFGALSAMVWLGTLWPNPYLNLWTGSYIYWGDTVTLGIQIAVWLLTLGLVGSRVAQLLSKSRAAMLLGFTSWHLRNAFQALEPEGEDRPAEPDRRELPPVLSAMAYSASLVLLALAWVFLWNLDVYEWTGWLGLAKWLSVTFLLVSPVLVGRAFAAKAVRDWPLTNKLWIRLWRGRAGESVFRLARIGLRENLRQVPAAQATEALVGGAAVEFFQRLPPEYRVRLDEVPGLVERLESAAGALRMREAELMRALDTVGTVGLVVDRRVSKAGDWVGARDLHSVQSHRSKAVAELESAKEAVGARLSATVAALENLRLGLLRLQAGVGTPEDLTTDLRVAREIESEVENLLEGQHQAAMLLGEPRPSAGPDQESMPSAGGEEK